ASAEGYRVREEVAARVGLHLQRGDVKSTLTLHLHFIMIEYRALLHHDFGDAVGEINTRRGADEAFHDLRLALFAGDDEVARMRDGDAVARRGDKEQMNRLVQNDFFGNI